MRKTLSMLVATALLGAPAYAAEIVPVSVEANSTFTLGNNYKPENLINGSGLSDGLHDNNFRSMWMTDLGVTTGLLTFDLGDTFALDAANIWQYNFGTNTPVISTLDRGANEFAILTSLDGVTYDQIFAGNMTRSADGSPVSAQSFGLNGMAARYVQISILSNFAGGTIYEDEYPVGLSEVRFDGNAVAPVPEPSSWALMIVGFAAAGVGMRTRKAKQLRLKLA